MLLSEAVFAFCEARSGLVAPRTVSTYRRRLAHLVAFLEDVPAGSVTLDDLRRYRAHLSEQSERYSAHPCRPSLPGALSLQTILGRLKAVRVLFRWLFEEGHITNNPAARFRLPPDPERLPKAISDESITQLLAAASSQREFYAARDYALVAFLADTGCRVGGLVRLRVDDLDLDRRRALVTEKGRGGGKSRYVFFGARTAAALRSWLQLHPGGVYVFPGLYGAPLTPQAVNRLLKRLARSAGVSGRTNPHAFRHAFARRLLDHGADLGTVSTLMGHSDVNTTHEYYARWNIRELQGRHARFSGFDDLAPD